MNPALLKARNFLLSDFMESAGNFEDEKNHSVYKLAIIAIDLLSNVESEEVLRKYCLYFLIDMWQGEQDVLNGSWGDESDVFSESREKFWVVDDLLKSLGSDPMKDWTE